MHQYIKLVHSFIHDYKKHLLFLQLDYKFRFSKQLNDQINFK